MISLLLVRWPNWGSFSFYRTVCVFSTYLYFFSRFCEFFSHSIHVFISFILMLPVLNLYIFAFLWILSPAHYACFSSKTNISLFLCAQFYLKKNFLFSPFVKVIFSNFCNVINALQIAYYLNSLNWIRGEIIISRFLSHFP